MPNKFEVFMDTLRKYKPIHVNNPRLKSWVSARNLIKFLRKGVKFS